MTKKTKPSRPEPESINRHLGDRVKRLRSERGWSLEALANASGVSRSMLSEVERGRANPPLAVAYRIAQAFGLSLGELVDAPASTPRIEVIRADDRNYHYRSDRACSIRTLSPLHLEKSVEYYEVVIRPGGALRSLPHFAGARELLGGALEHYRELGSRLGEALTHNDLGRAATGMGDFPAAVRSLRAALREHRRLDHRIGQSTALMYLGSALRRAGDLAGAVTALHEASQLNREINNRSGEAMVLNELGAVHRLSGDLERALTAHREALALADGVPSPFDRALSLAGFGQCALAQGRRREGAAQLRAALAILDWIDAAEASEIAAEVTALRGSRD